jgi:hypothetical protein
MWPEGEAFDKVLEDLGPMIKAYAIDPERTDPADNRESLQLPEGFEELPDDPLTNENGTTHAVPWVFSGLAGARQRGEALEGRPVTIRGVTIVQTLADGTEVFRRYVDWAGVWAQLGRSTGRGEEPVGRDFIAPDGSPLERDPDTGKELV